MTDSKRWAIASRSSFRDLSMQGLTPTAIIEEEATVTFAGTYERDPAEPAIEIDKLEVVTASLHTNTSAKLRSVEEEWRIDRMAGSAGGRLDVIRQLLPARFTGPDLSGNVQTDFDIAQDEAGLNLSAIALFRDLTVTGFLEEGGAGVLRSETAEVSLDGAVTSGPSGIVTLDSFSIKTDFAEVAGSAKLRFQDENPYPAVSITRLLCDLAALAENTEDLVPDRFVFAGKLEGAGDFSITRDEGALFETSVKADGLRIAETADGKVLFEDSLAALLAGAWRRKDTLETLRFSRAELSTDAHPNLLRLSGKNNFVRNDGSLSIDGEADMPLALVTPLAEKRFPGYSGAGQIRWKGKVDLLADKALTLKGEFASRDLDLTLPREGKDPLRFAEPRLDANIDLSYDLATGDLRVPALAVEGDDIKLSATLVFESLGEELLPNEAEISLEADLAKLSERYGGFVSALADLKPAGTLKAHVKATTKTRITDADAEITVTSLALGEGAGRERFGNDPVTAKLKLTADRANQRIGLTSLSVSSLVGGMNAKGELTRYTTDRNADFNVDANADLTALSDVLRTVLPEDVRFDGKGKAVFVVKGKLAGNTWKERVPAIKALGKIGFQKMSRQGLVIGPMEVPFALNNGLLEITQSNGPLNEGTLTVAGSVDLNQEPRVYELTSTLMVIKDMRLKSDVQFIRFLTPIFGNLAEVNGWADIELYNAHVPLSDDEDKQKEIKANGKVSYREVSVKQSLMLARLLDVIGGGKGEMQDLSPTTFEVKEGRVYLGDTSVRYAGQVIAFGGSVGLDSSLDLMARVLITERLLGENASLAELLVGEKVGVPITGTLDDPKMGRDIFQKNLKNIVKGVLKRTLNVGEQLKKILPPLPGGD